MVDLRNKFGGGIIVLVLFFSALEAAGAADFISRQMTMAVGSAVLSLDGQIIAPEITCMISPDGVTMVPLRDVAAAMGKSVVWDQPHRTIYLQRSDNLPVNKAGQANDLLKADQEEKDAWLEDLQVIRNLGPFFCRESGFMIAGGAHRRGVAVQLAEKQTAEFVIRLNGAYSGVQGWLGVEDQSMNSSGAYIMTILADQSIIFASEKIIPAALPRYFTAQIAPGQATTLRFQVQWQDSGFGGDAAQLMAVLADIKMDKIDK